MWNEDTDDYYHSPSELTSRIHPLIFLWIPISMDSYFYLSRTFLEFFVKVVYPTMVAENRPLNKGGERGRESWHPTLLFLKSYFAKDVFLEICFVPFSKASKTFLAPASRQRPWKSFKFMVLRLLEINLWAKKLNLFIFAHFPKQKEITHFTWTAFSENLFFPQQKTERIMKLKKWPKLNLRGYWSQVLITSTIFAVLTFLVAVLFCHNLDSSILKCEGSII